MRLTETKLYWVKPGLNIVKAGYTDKGTKIRVVEEDLEPQRIEGAIVFSVKSLSDIEDIIKQLE